MSPGGKTTVVEKHCTRERPGVWCLEGDHGSNKLQSQTTLDQINTHPHTEGLVGGKVCVYICNSIISLLLSYTTCQAFHKILQEREKQEKQSEFYFQNDSQGSSTDPFPSETSITREIYLKHLTI